MALKLACCNAVKAVTPGGAVVCMHCDRGVQNGKYVPGPCDHLYRQDG